MGINSPFTCCSIPIHPQLRPCSEVDRITRDREAAVYGDGGFGEVGDRPRGGVEGIDAVAGEAEDAAL